MNRTIRKYIAMGIGMLAFLTGCSEDIPQEKPTTTASFRMATRATENSAQKEITKNQFTRLYVSERKPESGKPATTDPQFKDQYDIIFYCDKYYDLTGQSYLIENLLGVWYKFAFVCVPNIGNEMGSKMFPNSHIFDSFKDLFDFTIDYSPVLKYQSDLNKASSSDLAIYRKIIDRWIDADMPTSEDVLMSRITGQLVLNMGKPADQFDTKTKGEVTQFEVNVETSQKCYIRDEACDSVIVVTPVVQKSFIWKVDEKEGQKSKQILPIALLPGMLTNATVTVSFKNGTPEVYALKGHEEKGEPDDIMIKKNRRTIVLFNGMVKEFYEVRYAGFADGNDATVDVDDDAWNGWNEK